MRDASDGCDAISSANHRGGSSSARFCSARRRNARIPASRSPVAASAKRSARRSIARDTAFATGASAS